MTTTATTTQMEFNEENFPVGTPLAWFYTNSLSRWEGGILLTWEGDVAETDTYRITHHTNQHTIVDPPDAYTPGTRVRVTRDVAVGTTGTVTTRVGTVVHFTTDDGIEESRQFWALEQVAPAFEVGDWYTYTIDGFQYGSEVTEAHSGAFPEGAVKVPRFEVGDRVRLERGGEDLEGVVTGFFAAPDPIVELDGTRSGWCAWRFDKVEATTGAELADGMNVAYHSSGDIFGQWYGGTIGADSNVIRLNDQGVLTLSSMDDAIDQASIVVVPVPPIGAQVKVARPSFGSDLAVGQVFTVEGHQSDQGNHHLVLAGVQGQHNTFQFDIVTEDEPESTEPEPDEYQVGDWVVWSDANVGRITGVHDESLDTDTMRSIAKDTQGLRKADTSLTTGDRVRVARGYSHIGQVGTITRVLREEDEFRRRLAEVDVEGYGQSSFYLHTLDAEPLTEEEERMRALQRDCADAINAYEDMVEKVRNLAFSMKSNQDYCGELENFLDNLGLDPRPKFEGEITVTWKVSLLDDDDDHSVYMRDHRSRVENRIREYMQGLDLTDIEEVDEVEAEMTDLTVTLELPSQD